MKPAPSPMPPAASAALRAPAALAPDSPLLRHPQARHELLLAGRVRLAYAFARSARRSVGLNVGPDGVSVRAPLRLPLAQVEQFLHSKADWVLDKLMYLQQELQAQPPLQWRVGAEIAYLGQRVPLPLMPALPGLEGASTPAALRRSTHAWLQQRAYAHFVERLNHFAPLLGVRWRSLRLSQARTSWGSAKANGSLRLNWRLIQLAPELIDYVVVHELAHLIELNHSPAFWRIVNAVLPDQAQRRAELARVRLDLD